MVDDRLAIRRRDAHQEIEVPDGLAVPAQAPRHLDLSDRWMRPQVLDERSGRRDRLGQQVAFAEALPAGHSLLQFLLALGAETGQRRDPALAAGLLQSRRRVDPERLDQGSQALRSEPRNPQQVLDPGGELGAQLVVQRERAGEHDLRDGAHQTRTDSLDLAQRAGLVEILRIFGHALDGPRAVRIGAAAKRILALELEEIGDFPQNLRDRRAVDPRARGRERCAAVAHSGRARARLS